MFGIKNCLNLKIYTEGGDNVLTIDYLNEARIIKEGNCAYLFLSHEVNDFELLELMYGKGDNKSDFQKDAEDIEISFGMEMNPKHYKGIGIFNITTGNFQDKEFKLIFNNIEFCNFDKFKKPEILKLSGDKVTEFNTVIKINLDENKKFFTLKR